MLLGLDLYTHHTNPQGLCSNNVGIYAVADNGVTAGTMRNSDCKLGVWGGYSWRTNTLYVRGMKVSAGLTVGVATGYINKPVVPLVVPSIKVGPVRFGILPKAKGAQSGGVHVSYEVTL